MSSWASDLRDYVKRELEIIGFTEDSEDELKRMLGAEIINLVESYIDASYLVAEEYLLDGKPCSRLINFLPISPLTGEYDEWLQIDEYRYKNKRCGSVFKELDESPYPHAYDLDGKVFVDPSGRSYTNAESIVYILFPYVPFTEYIGVDAEGNIVSSDQLTKEQIEAGCK